MRITSSTIEKVFRASPCSVETMQLQGFELIKEFFVDSSGFGLEDEPALTRAQFLTKLEALLSTHGMLTAKLTNIGQFQIYIGLFKRVKRGLVKRISQNVFERFENGYKVVRLYDTDIVKIKNHEYQLFNGGYATVTTKKWINKYLPNGMGVYQKNWNWYIYNEVLGKRLNQEFKEGIVIYS